MLVYGYLFININTHTYRECAVGDVELSEGSRNHACLRPCRVIGATFATDSGASKKYQDNARSPFISR